MQPVTDANLFHLAPLVCLKFRGRKLVGREADRVTETALANYVVNSDPEGVDHGLESKPLLAFAVCYVTAHLALDLVDEKQAEAILNYCEEHLEEDDESSAKSGSSSAKRPARSRPSSALKMPSTTSSARSS